MGLGLVATRTAKELVVVVRHILGIFMGAGARRNWWWWFCGGWGGEGLGYYRGCRWVLGDLVAAMGAVGVGGIGYYRGCGWVLGEFEKKKKIVFLIIF